MEKLHKRPNHVAIIMDGNGRWAQEHGLSRSLGHKEGVRVVETVISSALDWQIDYLTLYAFSSENWKRSVDEVSFLMSLFREYMLNHIPFLKKNNIKLRFIGEKKPVPEDICNLMINTEKELQNNTGMNLLVALNYGGRWELLQAIREILLQHNKEDIELMLHSKEFSVLEEVFERYLYTAGMPDPDLIIRTSGEKRLSNFLLWQSAYAEYFFTEKMWPDFEKEDFNIAINDYMNRKRRYGTS